MLKVLTYEKIVADIKRQNYVEVPSLVPKEMAKKAAESFIDFLTLPQLLKDEFAVMADEADRGSDSGYANRKKAKGSSSDDKEFFNYRRVSEALFKDVIYKNANEPKVKNFFDSAWTVLEEAVKTMAQIIKMIDAHRQGIYEKIFLINPNRLICLRFVKYDPASTGEFLATAHYDRGSCSLAIAESSPRLRVGKDNSSLKAIKREGSTAIFMPALTFANATGLGDFTPAWHDVVQESANTYSKGV